MNPGNANEPVPEEILQTSVPWREEIPDAEDKFWQESSLAKRVELFEGQTAGWRQNRWKKLNPQDQFYFSWLFMCFSGLNYGEGSATKIKMRLDKESVSRWKSRFRI